LGGGGRRFSDDRCFGHILDTTAHGLAGVMRFSSGNLDAVSLDVGL
jgi:hypothetical protein